MVHLKVVLFLIFSVVYLPLFPQLIKDSDLLIVDSDVKLDAKNKDNAPLLVEKLIKKKNFEK